MYRDGQVAHSASENGANTMQQSPAKRRRSGGPPLSVNAQLTALPLVTKPQRTVRFQDGVYYTGSSGTLALLCTVAGCAESRLGDHDFIMKARTSFQVEDFPPHSLHEEPLNFSSYENPLVVNQLIDTYLSFVRGVYDLFDDEELKSSVESWHFQKNDTSVCSAIINLVLAIGASQRGRANDMIFAEALFDQAYQATACRMLEPPTIGLLQALMLTSLYLFVNFRRNTAFAILGSAIRAAEALGLSHEDHLTMPKTADQIERTRAWKCLRILDVSSCASLGRVLATKKDAYAKESNELAVLSIDHGMTDQIDTAGFRLCDIAETILVEVYERRNLWIAFATANSQRLREWAQGLPDILILDQHETEFESRLLADQICLNHLTCAYYWTIMLLTRPFLEHAAMARAPATLLTKESEIFVDACIHSAIRCIDATAKLLHFSNLPKKLYLINNTTLVSALVLGLVSFTDAFKQYPLASSIAKAQMYLSRMSGDDKQAQLYHDIIVSMKSAIETFQNSLAAHSMQQRSAQVDQLFGNVVDRGKASCLQAGCSGFEYLSMTPAFDESNSLAFPASPTFSSMWELLRTGDTLPLSED